MGRCDWPLCMTHGRVTVPQMEDKVQIVRVMTHGRVTAPQMEDKVQIYDVGQPYSFYSGILCRSSPISTEFGHEVFRIFAMRWWPRFLRHPVNWSKPISLSINLFFIFKAIVSSKQETPEWITSHTIITDADGSRVNIAIILLCDSVILSAVCHCLCVCPHDKTKRLKPKSPNSAQG